MQSMNRFVVSFTFVSCLSWCSAMCLCTLLLEANKHTNIHGLKQTRTDPFETPNTWSLHLKELSGAVVHGQRLFFPKAPESHWSSHCQLWTKLRQRKMSHNLCPSTSTESAWSVTYITLKTSLCPGLCHPTRGLLAKGKKSWNILSFKLWTLPPHSVYIFNRWWENLQ